MENFQAPTTYTSPWTGVTYDIVAVPQSRVDYHEFMNPATRYIREYTQYTFYQGDKLVTFTFDLDEKHLSDIFGEIEGVYSTAGVGSRFD
jgi:hypothetical protein